VARGYYETGVRSGSLTAAGNYADLRAGASIPLRVVEIGVSMGVAGASPTLGLARETAVGTASTTTVPQAEDTADPASSALVGTAWSGAPTVAAVAMRRITLPASLGAGWVWAWPESNPLIIPVSLAVIVELLAISSAVATAVDVYFRHLE
jgi:hypothetical protein